MKTILRAILALPLMGAMPVKPMAPSEIVAAAPAQDWIAMDAADLLVMDLAPDRDGASRRIVLQLAPPPFSMGWVNNIRHLARAKFWDGLSVVRVQDNYVVQWRDPNAEDPASARPLPHGLASMTEADYVVHAALPQARAFDPWLLPRNTRHEWTGFYKGWPIAGTRGRDGVTNWLVHCYAMVGAGRSLSPDTGSGAELYTVIGHAPRHLDRNIALVGRVVQGIEHLSALPRGGGPLGFYEKAQERVAIRSVRIAADLPDADRPKLAYLSTEAPSFRDYAEARANRRDAFFNIPAGGADVCNIPVPIRILKAR